MIDPSDILRRMQLVMGAFPADSRKPALQWKIVDESVDASVIRRKVLIGVECDAGGNVTDWCPAWWLIPAARAAENSTPGPAVLCLHQTNRIGKDETIGLNDPVRPAFTDERCHYAIELARRGVVTLSPDYPGFGEYRIDAYSMGYASATIKAVWNHRIALDFLCRTPHVDPDRIGCIGHSLGGHNALFLAAFDSRVRAAVSSCGFNPWAWNDEEGRGKPGDLGDWSHRGYMPLIKERYADRAENMPFDFDEVLAAIAPRALFINAPEKDFFLVDGVRECVASVRPLFPPGLIECLHPDCDHNFPPHTREAAYPFLEGVL